MNQYSLIEAIAEIAYQMNIPPVTIIGIARADQDNELGTKFWYLCNIRGPWIMCSLPSKQFQHLLRIESPNKLNKS